MRKPPLSVIIRCENCEKPFAVWGSNFKIWAGQRIYYAICPWCKHLRHEVKIREGEFRCEECQIIKEKKRRREPIKGLCWACYLRLRRFITSEEKSYDISNGSKN
ncbi:MAG: hypothetical protein DDT22_00787 [candidate division WS2 bacterium]|nr:hypothetical protein [Candidatus Lithacetigena glycinireducens]